MHAVYIVQLWLIKNENSNLKVFSVGLDGNM